MNKDIEKKVVQAFFVKQKQERVLYELNRPWEKRTNLLETIEARNLLDSRYVHEIPKAMHSIDQINAILKKHGAPKECYVISGGGEYDEYDGKEVFVLDALEYNFGQGAFFLSCIHGELAYFEGHKKINGSERYLLKRHGNKEV